MSRVFGYGSLVNGRTHGYTGLRTARLSGYRRIWRQSTLREVAFLSIVEADFGAIEGLLADVPAAEWDALDHRERAYDKRDVAGQCTHDGPEGPVIVYAVKDAVVAPPDTTHPILLSYLDVVAEGYLDHFGQPGLARFVESTDGWNAPILDDRAAPLYGRHTAPDAAVTGIVDDMLRDIGSQMLEGTPERLDALRSNPDI